MQNYLKCIHFIAGTNECSKVRHELAEAGIFDFMDAKVEVYVKCLCAGHAEDCDAAAGGNEDQ